MRTLDLPRPPTERQGGDQDKRRRARVARDLVAVCRDGAFGFRLAAEEVKTPACQSLFSGFARERAVFADELLAAGVVPRDQAGGLARLHLHRRWVDFKARVSRRPLAHVLRELAREEEAALAAYDAALASPLGASLEAVVRRQRAAVQRACDDVASLLQVRCAG
jgi:uncharacterized protein (TIGR02284 family)